MPASCRRSSARRWPSRSGSRRSPRAIVICVAFPFTYLLTRMRRRAQVRLLVFILAVLSLSEVIIGFSWSTLLSRTAGLSNLLVLRRPAGAAGRPGPRAFGALLVGLCYLGFPYTVLVLYPALSRLDPELPEASRMLGASPLRTFFSVVVPVLRSSIISALIMVFVFNLGAFLLPQVLGRPEHWTLSVLITDQAVFQSNIPFAAAMAVFLMLVCLVLVGVTLACRPAAEGRAMSNSGRNLFVAPGRAVPGGAPGRGRGRLAQRREAAALPAARALARLVRRAVPRARLAERAQEQPDHRACSRPRSRSRSPSRWPISCGATGCGTPSALFGARPGALHAAAGHHGAGLPGVLGQHRLLRPDDRDADLARDLLRDPAAGHDLARLRIDRPAADRGLARSWAPTTARCFAP